MPLLQQLNSGESVFLDVNTLVYHFQPHPLYGQSGHYCWACDRYRPNERFSGSGHARHLCRECAKLGADELNYRQAVRNIERCLNFDGTVRRKRRGFVQQFLGHEDLRLRAWAEELLTGIPVTDEDDDEEFHCGAGEPDDFDRRQCNGGTVTP